MGQVNALKKSSFQINSVKNTFDIGTKKNDYRIYKEKALRAKHFHTWNMKLNNMPHKTTSQLING